LRRAGRKITGRFAGIAVNIVFWLCMAVLLWIVVQVFFFTSYRVPSDSMEPAIMPGDRIFVNKTIPGARIFDLIASLKGERVKIHRLPGIRSLRRNDVIVFNNPYPDKNTTGIAMDVMKYYVKRCIALPGDSLVICDGYYRVIGTNEPLGYLPAQSRLAATPDSLIRPGVLRPVYPNDAAFDWTIKNFGPLYVPRAGDSITLNRKNFLLYRPLIEWEQGCTVERRDSTVRLHGREIEGYRFLKSYCFAAGDNVTQSHDSRYWGLVPEEYVAGVVIPTDKYSL
jgi:signal peptidase I